LAKNRHGPLKANPLTNSIFVPVELWDVDAVEADVQEEHLGQPAEEERAQLAGGVLASEPSAYGSKPGVNFEISVCGNVDHEKNRSFLFCDHCFCA
jgi:hypothetical protein